MSDQGLNEPSDISGGSEGESKKRFGFSEFVSIQPRDPSIEPGHMTDRRRLSPPHVETHELRDQHGPIAQRFAELPRGFEGPLGARDVARAECGETVGKQ